MTATVTATRSRTGRAGRPSKFTPERRQRIIAAIKAGNYYDTACKYAGVTYQTFNQWRIRGQQADHKDPEDLSEEDLDYLAFYEALNEAEAQAEMVAVMRWREQMPNDWKAAKDFLARRHPERWGQKVEVTVGKLDDEILALLAEEMGEVGEGDPTQQASFYQRDEDIVDAELVELPRTRELPKGTDS